MNHQRSIQQAILGFGMDTITLAGPLRSQAGGDARRRLQPGHAEGQRPGRPPGRLEGRGAGGARRAACAAPASRCCATSKACPATCTSTRWISPRRCWRCARRWAATCCWPAPPPPPMPRSDLDHIARDLRKLAMLAIPYRHPHRLRRPVVGPHTSTSSRPPGTWCAAPTARTWASGSTRSTSSPPRRRSTRSRSSIRTKIFLVQLSDFMWQETRSFEERMATARTFRVFPGEGVHTAQLVELVLRSTRWATPATTASRSSTTTTCRCRCRWWRSARGARPCGWPRMCCAARCRCRTSCGCGPRKSTVRARGQRRVRAGRGASTRLCRCLRTDSWVCLISWPVVELATRPKAAPLKQLRRIS